MLETQGDTDFHDVISGIGSFGNESATRSVTQLQFPYSATLEIKDKMTVLNLRKLIVADEPKHRYRCEFQSVELFLGIIISTGSNIKIIEPKWLRDRLVESAQRILESNKNVENDIPKKK